MTEREIAAFIVARWRDDHAPAAIMMQLITLGYPFRKAEILRAIRIYIDCQTENRTYRARRAI